MNTEALKANFASVNFTGDEVLAYIEENYDNCYFCRKAYEDLRWINKVEQWEKEAIVRKMWKEYYGA